MVQGALAAGDEAESARREAVARRASEGALRRRLQRASEKATFPKALIRRTLPAM
jgi:hypothetical protein